MRLNIDGNTNYCVFVSIICELWASMSVFLYKYVACIHANLVNFEVYLKVPVS